MTDSRNHQNITPDQKPGVLKHTQAVFTQISSPLPPPEMLLGYERVQPGLINKIIEMTELEGAHRRELEKSKLQAEISNLQRGDELISRAQGFALILSIFTIIIGGITGILGAQITGSIIGASGVIGIIGAFLKNSKREK